ncbi:MAG: hypothetical protein KatS3mg077_0534 [Candidatus Binatia bacterium]|nr:MAG: hypothetical protein KatS3mg077_0534 [Candidatus Binatia bacterium]
MVLLLCCARVQAEIYAWRDADGVRHFTNVREEIPAAYREEAEVVVGAAWVPSARAELPACEAERPARQAQVVVVPRPAARREERATVANAPVIAEGGAVSIQGPLAVAFHDTPPAWPVRARVPLVTTAFDLGRSRHLTLRQLAEEQRWIEEFLGWSPGLPHLLPFAGGPRPPCVAWRTCTVR